MRSDPTVIGKTIRLGSFDGTRSAVIVGVLEPAVPYPLQTELIANVVTSPHHLSATMVTGREHRMTEVFARLAPGAQFESAQAELRTVYAGILAAHPEVYKPAEHFRIDVTRMHDQINARARTILWVLFAASGLLFVIACSNVANLILARTVRRESELAIRSALGATTAGLRRSLLAEGLVLCGSGALAGVLIAAPMVAVLARYASRFSVRALDLQLDFSLVWVGMALALIAAVFLAFIPRLPSAERVTWQRCIEQRRAHYRRKPPAASDFCRHANHRVVPVAGWGRRLVEDAAGAGKNAAAVRNRACSGGEPSRHVVWPDTRAGARFLS